MLEDNIEQSISQRNIVKDCREFLMNIPHGLVCLTPETNDGEYDKQFRSYGAKGWKYEHCVFGNERFRTGLKIVTYQEVPIWSRVYRESQCVPVPKNSSVKYDSHDFHNCVAKLIGEVKRDGSDLVPIRGFIEKTEKYRKRGFLIYTNQCLGTMARFEGIERVWFTPKTVIWTFDPSIDDEMVTVFEQEYSGGFFNRSEMFQKL